MKKMPDWLKRTLLVLLCVAALGGGIYGVLLLARGNSGQVNVYPVMDFVTNYADDRAETQGVITTDKIQSVYISSTQKVTRIYVHEGDTVRAGDPLLAFDTTLTDLELERKNISVQKLQLELEDAKKNLAKVNTYRILIPATPAEPGEEPELKPLSLPFFRTGNGQKKSPYVYIWNDKCSFDTTFVDSILPQLPENYDPQNDAPPSVWAVFEVRDSDALEGSIERSWAMNLWRTASGGVEFRIQEASGNYDGSQYEEADEPTQPGSTVPAFSREELISMRREAQNKITELELELEKAKLDYDTLQFEKNNGMVTSKIDGVVKAVRDPDQALAEQMPAILVSGGGGYYVTGAMSEAELEAIHVGDTVSVMSWQTYSQTDAQIISISEYPVKEGNGYTHWSEGNSNSSLYPFTVYLDEDTPVREGEYVNITYNPFGSGASGLFLDSMFIRREGGQSFVFVRDASGKLEKREIPTERSLWGSYIQVLGGLTPEDYIAFPYGRNLREGAKTAVASSETLYNY